MATLTNEQIEAMKQQVEAGADELSDETIEKVAGGVPLDNPSIGFYSEPKQQPVI